MNRLIGNLFTDFFSWLMAALRASLPAVFIFSLAASVAAILPLVRAISAT
jgi:hypothetical protein